MNTPKLAKLKARLEATFVYAFFGAAIVVAIYRQQLEKRYRELHPSPPFSESDSAPYRGTTDRP
jgi:hypothetical protein